ncbi:hypothetical protein CIPAW_07G108900 [Carya illinoinensis]|uniref:DUF4216 domain-containing protein n=1 Tax=Carya illinoinensis TaxID=32201 RepID=A0A8T1Q1T0_CARIL|nr:hypothetical protein CIPAW_07G108900 [Carya illinoinensis]
MDGLSCVMGVGSTTRNVQDQRSNNPLDVSPDLYVLACGPDNNSSVLVTGDHQSNNVDFYGVINYIMELHYIGGRHVFLFRCDWLYVGDKKQGVRVDDHMTSVNMDRIWYKDEPFVLACQACQCFYSRDLRSKRNWYVVQKYTNRNVYDIPLVRQVAENVDGQSNDDDAYQEDESSYDYIPMQCDDVPVSTPLNRTDIEPMQVDPCEVMSIPSQFINSTQAFIDDSLTASGLTYAYGDREYSDEEDLSTDEESVSE